MRFNDNQKSPHKANSFKTETKYHGILGIKSLTETFS